MAGEIAQEVAVVLALGGAAIGAGGSILAQVTAGIITSRREKKKLITEDKRWQAESDAKRRDRNFDRKVALFSSFLASAQAMERAATWGPPEAYEMLLEDSETQTLSEIRKVVEEIGLLAPEVHRHVQSTFAALIKMHAGMTRSDSQKYAPANRAAIGAAVQDVAFWLGHTRKAIGSYINHENVEWPEQAIAEHKRPPATESSLTH
ncbi:hypothetical protein [Arthrobacter sp. CG_A4]|uniref:hypothetical protein n=1 Tax=Arthrobacter sp. CG_A4 TaxID=3071706 RepID=UPI002E024597|nr:hypothetical protein [Arthrobacter sp. CG_A4]